MRAATAMVLASLNFSTPSMATDEAQIRSDCRADALRFCKAEIISGDRQRVVNCIVANRDKLRPRCAAHIS